MRNTIFLILILLFVYGMCFAEEYEKPDNFKGVKFGSSRTELVNKLKEASINVTRSYGESRNVWIDNFKLGDLTVTVKFYFYEDKFYQFEFWTPKHNADYFSLVKEEANYLAEILKNKYGPWKSKFDPSFIDISSDAIKYTHKWLFPKQTVFIGLTEYEFEYYAIARVYDDDIRKDKIEGIKSKSKSSAKDAADDF